MRLIRSENGVLIRHFPILNWLLGMIGIAAIIGMIATMIQRRLHIGSLWDELVYAFFVISIIAIAAYDFGTELGVRAPVTDVLVNAREKYVQIVRWRFYGKSVERYYFYQMDRFKSYKTQIFRRDLYRLALKLRNRRTLKLLIPIGKEKNAVTRWIKDLNKTLRSV